MLHTEMARRFGVDAVVIKNMVSDTQQSHNEVAEAFFKGDVPWADTTNLQMLPRFLGQLPWMMPALRRRATSECRRCYAALGGAIDNHSPKTIAAGLIGYVLKHRLAPDVQRARGAESRDSKAYEKALNTDVARACDAVSLNTLRKTTAAIHELLDPLDAEKNGGGARAEVVRLALTFIGNTRNARCRPAMVDTTLATRL
jgi:hypothetical protein